MKDRNISGGKKTTNATDTKRDNLASPGKNTVGGRHLTDADRKKGQFNK